MKRVCPDGCHCLLGVTEKVTPSLSCFICDTPARAFVEQVKSHTGYYGCDKCSQKGVWDGEMAFPDVDAPLPTDIQYRI